MTIATGTYEVRAFDAVAGPDHLVDHRFTADLPDPFAIVLHVEMREIDAFGHVNNTVYQRWMEACAWAHSAAVGLDAARCRALGRGMALKTVDVDYLRAAFAGQEILVLNWIASVDRLRAERRFQVVCRKSGATLARARASYVCIDLTTGAPTRMPAAFIAGYVVSASVRTALDPAAAG